MIEHNRFTCRWASFDILHPDEQQLQIVFHYRSDAPRGLQRSFVLSESSLRNGSPESEDNPYAAALMVKQALACYIYNSDKEAIDPIIAYLDSMADQDEIDTLRAEAAALQGLIVSQQKRLWVLENRIADMMGIPDTDQPWQPYVATTPLCDISF